MEAEKFSLFLKQRGKQGGTERGERHDQEYLSLLWNTSSDYDSIILFNIRVIPIKAYEMNFITN